MRLEGGEAISIAEALALLETEAKIDAGTEPARAVAELVGCEPRALRWAGLLARTLGWRALASKLARWVHLPGLLGSSPLPWAYEVDRVIASLSAPRAELLAVLAATDASFSWEVLEAAQAGVSIEAICELEEANLLSRVTRAGVVMFRVPYCVRAAQRVKAPEVSSANAARWLEAWLTRSSELRASMYGAGASAALSELACAIPLAERAILDDVSTGTEHAVELWARVSDAMFFEGAVDYASPAFERAVELANMLARESPSLVESRVRVRTAAARAALERGDPSLAHRHLLEARTQTGALGRPDLLSEIGRGEGWAELASAKLSEARDSFDRARELSEGASDPRGHADATAGLGILALLTGDPALARDLLGEALATHVVTRDAPREAAVRAMMLLLPEAPATEADVARWTAQIEPLRAGGQRWREALMLARVAIASRERGDAEIARARLAEARAAAALSKMSAATLVSALVHARNLAPGPTSALDETASRLASAVVVGLEGRSLALPNGVAHELTRHGSLRRLLWALTLAHEERPGLAMSTLDLIEAAWPGEKMKYEAATLRVYTTIRRLRAMGLEGALLTRDDGYLFDPDATIRIKRS